jgi:uncharacterized protein YycO
MYVKYVTEYTLCRKIHLVKCVTAQVVKLGITYAYKFLTLALGGCEQSVSCSDLFVPAETAGVGPTVDLELIVERKILEPCSSSL